MPATLRTSPRQASFAVSGKRVAAAAVRTFRLVAAQALLAGADRIVVVEQGVFYEVRHPDRKDKLYLETPAVKPQATRPATRATPVAASQKAA